VHVTSANWSNEYLFLLLTQSKCYKNILELARQYHHDVNSSATAKASMQAINQAYKEFLAQLNRGK